MVSNTTSKEKTEISSVEETTKEPETTQRYLLSALTSKPVDTVAEIKKTLTKLGAKVEKDEDLGLKKLAFAVGGQTEQNLISVYFQSSRSQLKEIEKEIEHVEGALRTLITSWKADLDEAMSHQRSRKEKIVANV